MKKYQHLFLKLNLIITLMLIVTLLWQLFDIEQSIMFWIVALFTLIIFSSLIFTLFIGLFKPVRKMALLSFLYLLLLIIIYVMGDFSLQMRNTMFNQPERLPYPLKHDDNTIKELPYPLKHNQGNSP
jgi:hypothetical protein